ncbi:hypothetical protein LR48_Vigan10g262100 [Vigna angularis]|uniref:Uncharacterized protein n=1 Tax=Phaseolus angularis TaxID=3914 RepID=A0A0L9VPQ2_PHAAN|nr:hypothetical protein LR48_Vigan10g262100 [Vigna angularis]
MPNPDPPLSPSEVGTASHGCPWTAGNGRKEGFLPWLLSLSLFLTCQNNECPPLLSFTVHTPPIIASNNEKGGRIRIGYYHRLGERHVQCQKDQINMPGRFSPANGRSPSERPLVAQRERSSSEQWTFVQRVHARDPKVDARLARERTLAQLGHSSSELWTFVQRGQKVDARCPARTLVQRALDVRPAKMKSGRSPSDQWTLAQRRTLAQRTYVRRPAKNHLQPFSLKTRSRGRNEEVWRGGDQRTLQSSFWVLPRWKITNFHRPIHALSLL